jgi:chorismate synthase
MGRLRYLTAGESHGQALIGILDGLPAGLALKSEIDIDPALAERQKGYGRSYRQKIEQDSVQILSGVRFGLTTGAPIALMIPNKDWQNWKDEMSVADERTSASTPVTIPRPGHADLAGSVKYSHTDDLRNVFERASARETAMRVAIGAVAKKLLQHLGITTFSYVRSIGQVDAGTIATGQLNEVPEYVSRSAVRTFSESHESSMIEAIDAAKKAGDTLGGTVETVVYGMPVGVGSSMQWDRKLDAKIAEAVMSIQAVKSIEIGDGKELAFRFGSESHDPISKVEDELVRVSNHSGGIEGGMTTGTPVVIRAAMKPISTLMKPLPSVDLLTGDETVAHIERSDVCAVPALSIIVEHVVALVLADALLDTFGGDTIDELQERINLRRLSYSSLLRKQ